MRHELVFLGCHSQFSSYLYTSASYLHSCKLLLSLVAATVQKHSDAIFFSIGASRMKTSKINAHQQIVVLDKQLSVRTHQTDTCESAFASG